MLLTRLLLDSGRVPRFGRTGTDRHRPLGQESAAIQDIFTRLAPDPLLQGAIARAAYPPPRWKKAVDSQLGAATRRKVPKTADPGVLRTVARMLVASQRKDRTRHVSVLSFNYDALLDEAVRQELSDEHLPVSLAHSVRDGDEFEQTWMDAGIFIYHLHGYLDDDQPQIVLDADSYVPVLRGDHWSWRCMERSLTAAGNSSLFIGLSLADPSLRYVLTRWKSWQTPVTGVYLAPPPLLPKVKDPRTVALMYRSIMDLYASVLDRLHLICYHLSSWREIEPILRAVGEAE